MSFLAFLVFGSLVGLISAYFYPKKRLKLMDLLPYGLAGVVISFLISFFGQTLGFFTSGQIFEWFGTLLGTIVLVACLRGFARK